MCFSSPARTVHFPREHPTHDRPTVRCVIARENVVKSSLFIRGKFFPTFPRSTPCAPISPRFSVSRARDLNFSDGVAMTWCAHDRGLLRSSPRERADERPTLSLLYNRCCALSLCFLCLARGKVLKSRFLQVLTDSKLTAFVTFRRVGLGVSTKVCKLKVSICQQNIYTDKNVHPNFFISSSFLQVTICAVFSENRSVRGQ